MSSVIIIITWPTLHPDSITFSGESLFRPDCRLHTFINGEMFGFSAKEQDPSCERSSENAVNHSSAVYAGLDRASSDTVTREHLSAVRRQFKVN